MFRCAIKEIQKNHLFDAENSRIKKEIDILKTLQSDKIVRYIDHFEENFKVYIVTEYYQVGIREKNVKCRLNKKFKLKIFNESCAVMFINCRNIYFNFV